MKWGEQEVVVVDGEVHTADNPYCDDPVCWCHTDVEYHDLVMHPTYQDGDVEQAYEFYEIFQEGR